MSGNTGIRGTKLFAEKQCGIGSRGAYSWYLRDESVKLGYPNLKIFKKV